MAQTIAVSVRKMVPNPNPDRKGKVEQIETKQIPVAKLKTKLGPENFKRFMDGERFKVGNYEMELS